MNLSKLERSFILDLINNAVGKLFDQDIPVGAVKMNFRTFKLLRASWKVQTQFDPVTRRGLLKNGRLWEVDVLVDRSVPNNTVLALSVDEYTKLREGRGV